MSKFQVFMSDCEHHEMRYTNGRPLVCFQHLVRSCVFDTLEGAIAAADLEAANTAKINIHGEILEIQDDNIVVPVAFVYKNQETGRLFWKVERVHE